MPCILLVKVNTAPVPPGPARWEAGFIVAATPDVHVFGAEEVPLAGNFYHVTVTDQDVLAAEPYLEIWRHIPSFSQVSRVGDDRLIEVSSSMVSASGLNAFTQPKVDSMLLDTEAAYDSHTDSTFRFNITATDAQVDFFMKRVEEGILNIWHARRRWYVTPAGMTFLGNNGGIASGTGAQVLTYLRDGLLD